MRRVGGSGLLTLLLAAAAHFGVPIFEYEPRLVKKALVGHGQAEKPQVRAMVLSLLARQRSRTDGSTASSPGGVPRPTAAPIAVRKLGAVL